MPDATGGHLVRPMKLHSIRTILVVGMVAARSALLVSAPLPQSQTITVLLHQPTFALLLSPVLPVATQIMTNKLGFQLSTICWAILVLQAVNQQQIQSVDSFRLGLAVKTVENEFFQLAQQGCNDRLNIFHGDTENQCLYFGPVSTANVSNPDPDGLIQADMIMEVLENQSIDGLAISVRNAQVLGPVIEAATAKGVPVITFDSDAPDSGRLAYVGTDNYFLGTTMAKVAQQISPNGGTFACIIANTSPNMMERMRGFRDQMNLKNKGRNIVWTEVDESPANYLRETPIAVAQTEAFARAGVTVVGAMGAGAMWSDGYEAMYNKIQSFNVTFVYADDFPLQIDFLSRGKVQGLVGQMPYEMGYLAASSLIDILEGREVPEIIGTNLITHLQVPVVLPDLKVDNNLIGNLSIVGFVLFGIIAALVLAFSSWTLCQRHLPVVRSAQPFFLLLVALGILVLGSLLIPLSFDDNGLEMSGGVRGKAICMSIPWLGCCGFAMTFSALFSKMVRLNRIISATREYHRVRVTALELAAPMLFLIGLNLVVLLLWTILDPLIYVRQDNPGTDGWNRIISTYGACRSEYPERYIIPLVLINLGALVAANWQAYKARKIKSEFSESKYIALAMMSYLQALLIGLPILFVVRDSPQAFYLTLSFMVFVLCVGLLLLIFVPKVVMASETESDQLESVKIAIQSAIRSTETTGAGSS